MPDWASGRRAAGFLPRHRWSGRLLLAVIGLVAGVVYAATPEPPRTDLAPITGRVERVVDGDTLDIAGQRIRLVGLDAPERDQTCTDAAGRDWGCGSAARAALQRLVAGATLRCIPTGIDRHGRLLATCRGQGIDPGEALVDAGLAVAMGEYREAGAAARTARRGLWAGSFVTPAEWRRQHGVAGSGTTGNPSRFERFLVWLLEAVSG